MKALQGSQNRYLDVAKKAEAEKIWARVAVVVPLPLDEFHDRGVQSIFTRVVYLKDKLAPFETGDVYKWSPLKSNLRTKYIQREGLQTPEREFLEQRAANLRKQGRNVSPVHAKIAIEFSEALVAKHRPAVMAYYEKVDKLALATTKDKKLSRLMLKISRLTTEIKKHRTRKNCRDSSKGCKLVRKREALIKSKLKRERVLHEKIMVP